jgi:hypothetical protein
MTCVSGLLKIGEAQSTLRNVGKRQRGSANFFYLILVALMMGGMFAGIMIAFAVFLALDFEKIHYGWDAGSVSMWVGWFGMFTGAVLYQRICKGLTVARFRKRLIQKGSPAELPLRMEIAPENLLYDVGDVKHMAKWSCVSEVFPSHGYWIFLAQASPFFAPKRFFADPDAERAFLKEALAHMSEAARGRSKEAVAFAEVN